MKQHPFTRPTIIAAVEFLGAVLTQAKFDQLIVRMDLVNELPLASPKSVAAKSALLAHAVLQRGASLITTVIGQMTLAELVVREAVNMCKQEYPRPEQAPFLRGLALDGYVVTWAEYSHEPLLRAALPEIVNLPASDDEVHSLLKHFNFVVSVGHLDQAIQAHVRGDWAAANSQVRTFLESLLNEIALAIDHVNAAQMSSENCRAFLADRGFLATDRKEWTADGRNFINGLFKMLHTDGAHPGLSDEDHCTFRLHLALLTSRTLLRRLKNGS